MRVTIDASPLLVRSAGVKNYLHYWIRALRELAGADAVRTFPLNLRFETLVHEGSMAGPLASLAGLARLHAVNHLGLPLVDGPGEPPEVFHASWLLHRPPRRARLTATLYDLTCWLLPAMHTRANVAAARSFADGMLRRARGLIAISRHTRDDAVRVLGLDAARIEVIWPGVPQAFFDVTPRQIAGARERYGLVRPYVLFVGTIEPRKNVARLLDAWEGLRTDLRTEFELVLAGPTGWAEPALLARLRRGVTGVRYLGYVPEADLPALTAGATVFAYPSLYEGFGLPVAQAMAAGTPVVTSAVSSLPEIGGEAVMLSDPASVSDLRAGLERLLESESLRQRLAEAGRRRAELFRWERAARESLKFFERIAGE
ncbi:MAG: glycosyltransferase family 1 protein [Bryobacterales bacterium]|nr:glycosyltransferase family 4 protein [Bryobacteraceae bacterium]MDW8131582.1 glycosyltransferase family 1 protein [Bryobacterales bacterium]